MKLYGTDSAEYTAVANAWAGINVGARPGGGDPGDGTTFESTTNVNIPDYGSAVTSSLTVSGRTGKAPSNLKVGVDIVHSWRGDLQIDLVAPDGSAYRLKNSGNDPAADVHETYTVNASSESANGTWKLRVQDQGPADTGYIDAWRLTFP
ncbi:Neutral metalloproteinase OS=Streptomyces tendae OX=1932 GN=GUR47_36255 PE=3 SV=1 [Streptomyces tendae]